MANPNPPSPLDETPTEAEVLADQERRILERIDRLPTSPTPQVESKCPICKAPVIRSKGYDNGLSGAAKIAGPDTHIYAPPGSAIMPTPPSDKPLAELLKAFQKAASNVEYSPYDEDYMKSLTDARQAIESAFSKLEAQLEAANVKAHTMWLDREGWKRTASERGFELAAIRSLGTPE
jgi:hypothetical protein